MKSDKIKLFVKLAVGVGLIAYVLKSRMIDFTALQALLLNPLNLALVFGFLFTSAFCCAFRWFLLSRAQGLSLSLWSMFELTMIGNFFNTFMPGSVGGDLIKAWYVAGREPKRKTKAVFTVLLDRVIGLSVIIFYAASTLFVYRAWLDQRPELGWLAYTIWGFSSAAILFALFFFSSPKLRLPGATALKTWITKIPRIAGLVEAAMLYRHHLSTIATALLLSGFSQFGMNLLHKIQGDALGISMDLPHYFFVVPIALTASAVPLLPGGLGVGQVAFFTLFQWVGMEHPEQGATLCTLMQVYTILFNCIGAFFYLKFKRRPEQLNNQRSGGLPIGMAAYSGT